MSENVLAKEQETTVEYSGFQNITARSVANGEVDLYPGLVDFDIWTRSAVLQPNTTYAVRMPANRENSLYFYIRNLSSSRLRVAHYRDNQLINSWTLRTNQRPGEAAQEILFPRMTYSRPASVVTLRITNPSSRPASIEWTANFVDD